MTVLLSLQYPSQLGMSFCWISSCEEAKLRAGEPGLDGRSGITPGRQHRAEALGPQGSQGETLSFRPLPGKSPLFIYKR